MRAGPICNQPYRDSATQRILSSIRPPAPFVDIGSDRGASINTLFCVTVVRLPGTRGDAAESAGDCCSTGALRRAIRGFHRGAAAESDSGRRRVQAIYRGPCVSRPAPITRLAGTSCSHSDADRRNPVLPCQRFLAVGVERNDDGLIQRGFPHVALSGSIFIDTGRSSGCCLGSVCRPHRNKHRRRAFWICVNREVKPHVVPERVATFRNVGQHDDRAWRDSRCDAQYLSHHDAVPK